MITSRLLYARGSSRVLALGALSWDAHACDSSASIRLRVHAVPKRVCWNIACPANVRPHVRCFSPHASDILGSVTQE